MAIDSEFYDDFSHMSSVQNLCWLMIIVDYTPQHIGDYNPIEELWGISKPQLVDYIPVNSWFIHWLAIIVDYKSTSVYVPFPSPFPHGFP